MEKLPNPATVLQCSNVLSEWSENLDRKDWDKVTACFTDEVQMDYSAVGLPWTGQKSPRQEYMAWLSSPTVGGNERIKTQHFIGACQWTHAPADRIKARIQVRAPHRLVPTGEGEPFVPAVTVAATCFVEFARVAGEGFRMAGLRLEPLFADGDLHALLALAAGTRA